MTDVLILGATGQVGSAAARVLRQRFCGHIVLGGRDEERLGELSRQLPNSSVRVIEDLQVVTPRQLGEVDVVLNCAGPATKLSQGIIYAALQAKVAIVDAGGNQALLEDVDPLAKAQSVPVWIAAGVQPGLVGVLLRVLHNRGARGSARVYCGGMQRFTKTAVLEYLHSLRIVTGYSGKSLIDGVPQMATNTAVKLPAGFSESAIPRRHIDEETLFTARDLKMLDIDWFNVADGEGVAAVLTQAIAGACSADDVVAVAESNAAKQSPYFGIFGSSTNRGGDPVIAQLWCSDSYQLTGAVAALAAGDLVAGKGEPGAKWASAGGSAIEWWSLLPSLLSDVSYQPRHHVHATGAARGVQNSDTRETPTTSNWEEGYL